MAITCALFAIYYNNLPSLQRKNDPNRLTNIKSAMELEDADFIKMVDDLKIDYDETDLREVEREVKTRVQRSASGSGRAI